MDKMSQTADVLKWKLKGIVERRDYDLNGNIIHI